MQDSRWLAWLGKPRPAAVVARHRSGPEEAPKDRCLKCNRPMIDYGAGERIAIAVDMADPDGQLNMPRPLPATSGHSPIEKIGVADDRSQGIADVAR